MEYKIVAGLHIAELEDQVRAMIGDGWYPLGGVAVMPTSAPYHNFAFYQSMARDPLTVEVETIEFGYGGPLGGVRRAA